MSYLDNDLLKVKAGKLLPAPVDYLMFANLWLLLAAGLSFLSDCKNDNDNLRQ